MGESQAGPSVYSDELLCAVLVVHSKLAAPITSFLGKVRLIVQNAIVAISDKMILTAEVNNIYRDEVLYIVYLSSCLAPCFDMHKHAADLHRSPMLVNHIL